MKYLIILFILVLITMISCFPLEEEPVQRKPSGFFMGIWHGWIAPISLILGFFDNNIRIYDSFNNGWWYDLGFYIAIIGGFGGLSIIRKKSKKKD